MRRQVSLAMLLAVGREVAEIVVVALVASCCEAANVVGEDSCGGVRGV